MVNKKGYIKTIEAVVAIIAILIFIFTALPKDVQIIEKKPTMVESNLENVVGEIITQGKYREEIIANDGECGEEDICDSFQELKKLAEHNLVPGYTYKFKVCDNPSCVVDISAKKDIYMEDVFIASYNIDQKPKVFRIWMWRK